MIRVQLYILLVCSLTVSTTIWCILKIAPSANAKIILGLMILSPAMAAIFCLIIYQWYKRKNKMHTDKLIAALFLQPFLFPEYFLATEKQHYYNELEEAAALNAFIANLIAIDILLYFYQAIFFIGPMICLYTACSMIMLVYALLAISRLMNFPTHQPQPKKIISWIIYLAGFLLVNAVVIFQVVNAIRNLRR